MKTKKRLTILIALVLLLTCAAYGEGQKPMVETAWYLQALKDSVMNVGNNARLKNVMERAQGGEEITLATIGGSITEGAGASAYRECWASRFLAKFSAAYGADSGAHVSLVNAGVGGTPSPFGYMRYRREVVDRVPAKDADGLPDIVVIEFSVNDWEEPTKHRCFESMVKEILEAPNEPAVILLFAVSRNGWNLQDDLRRIGDRYDLMMVSIRDGIYPQIGSNLPSGDFFTDEYHPTSLGHLMMADCLMQAIGEAAEASPDEAQDPDVEPVYGTDFMGLKTIFGDTETAEFTVDRGGFLSWDSGSYHNQSVGWVCGKNFYHNSGAPMDPLRITGVFRKCLVAWKATNDSSFGTAEILVDGRVVQTVRGGEGKWGQSEVVLILDDAEAMEHTLEIRVTEEGKQFTVTAISLVE